MSLAVQTWGQEVSKDGPGWLAKLRVKSMAVAAAGGPPKRTAPSWEHTDTSPLTNLRKEASQRAPIDPAVAGKASFQNEALRYVFVDGHYRPELSQTDDDVCVPLSANWDASRSELEAPGDALQKLGVALLQDGCRVHVKDDRPVHLLHVHATPGTRSSTRHFVEVAPGADGTVVESWVGSAPNTLSLHTTSIHCAPGARLLHVKQQLEHGSAVHKSRVDGFVEQDGHLASFLWGEGAAWSRTGTSIALAAPGASCAVDGLLLGRRKQFHDAPTRIDHQAPHTTSRELYKAIMDDEAHSVFLGSVVVQPGAIGTDSVQANRNLLQSPKARADSTPQLEIHADDVQCRHGSTTGQLDQDALFFLRARGIDRSRGELLLTKAFAGEVLEGLGPWGLRTRMERRVEEWFGGAS